MRFADRLTVVQPMLPSCCLLRQRAAATSRAVGQGGKRLIYLGKRRRIANLARWEASLPGLRERQLNPFPLHMTASRPVIPLAAGRPIHGLGKLGRRLGWGSSRQRNSLRRGRGRRWWAWSGRLAERGRGPRPEIDHHDQARQRSDQSADEMDDPVPPHVLHLTPARAPKSQPSRTRSGPPSPSTRSPGGRSRTGWRWGRGSRPWRRRRGRCIFARY